MNQFQVAVEHYAGDGWPLFPLKPLGKTPATRHGLNDATTDHAKLTRWWQSRPEANIGIACGPARLVVVDIDVRHGDGHQAWHDLAEGHDTPTTFTVETPSGGRHLYYQAPDAQIRNSAGRLADNIDIRADGGYVVAPPSVTDDGYYDLTDDTPPAPLPAWLAELLVDRPRVVTATPRPTLTPLQVTNNAWATRALRDEIEAVSTAVVGTRNDRLNTAAFNLGQIVAGGSLDVGDVCRALMDAALATGLTEKEIHATITSGINAGQRTPRTAK